MTVVRRLQVTLHITEGPSLVFCVMPPTAGNRGLELPAECRSFRLAQSNKFACNELLIYYTMCIHGC